MERLVLCSVVLIGPCYVLMILGLVIARRVFPNTQILFDLNEWVLLLVAAIVAMAVAGVVVQLI
jgi:hypothetical protein